MVSKGVSDTSFSVVVSERDAQDSVERLHGEFFGDAVPDDILHRSDEEAHP